MPVLHVIRCHRIFRFFVHPPRIRRSEHAIEAGSKGGVSGRGRRAVGRRADARAVATTKWLWPRRRERVPTHHQKVMPFHPAFSGKEALSTESFRLSSPYLEYLAQHLFAGLSGKRSPILDVVHFADATAASQPAVQIDRPCIGFRDSADESYRSRKDQPKILRQIADFQDTQ